MVVIIWLIPYLSMLMTQHSIWHWRQIHILKWNHALVSRLCAPNQGPLKQILVKKYANLCLPPSICVLFLASVYSCAICSVHGQTVCSQRITSNPIIPFKCNYDFELVKQRKHGCTNKVEVMSSQQGCINSRARKCACVYVCNVYASVFDGISFSLIYFFW